jgi:hypothetical protein
MLMFFSSSAAARAGFGGIPRPFRASGRTVQTITDIEHLASELRQIRSSRNSKRPTAECRIIPELKCEGLIRLGIPVNKQQEVDPKKEIVIVVLARPMG